MMNLYQKYLFDTHTHLHDKRFDEDREEVLQECKQTMVGWINVGSDLKTSIESLKISQDFPMSFASAGVHPHDAGTHSLLELEEIEKLYSHAQVIAAGEMGLDYYYDNSPREIQQEIFRHQLESAKKNELPCIIHVRDAFEDFFKIVDEVSYYKGVVHCFSGNVQQLLEIDRRGFYAGYGGVMTFKNAQETRDSFLKTPLEKVLLETDCPYLAPVPKRGKRNIPFYVSHVASYASELRSISIQELLETTYANACELFNIDA